VSAAEQSRCSLGPWRAIRCASSWRIYDQQGNAIARLATTEITEPRRAYDARLMARAPELEMMLAECAGMLGAAADSLKGRGALRPDAEPVLREQQQKCIALLRAIAVAPTENAG